jgi:hypothetical protein
VTDDRRQNEARVPVPPSTARQVESTAEDIERAVLYLGFAMEKIKVYSPRVHTLLDHYRDTLGVQALEVRELLAGLEVVGNG